MVSFFKKMKQFSSQEMTQFMFQLASGLFE